MVSENKILKYRELDFCPHREGSFKIWYMEAVASYLLSYLSMSDLSETARRRESHGGEGPGG